MAMGGATAHGVGPRAAIVLGVLLASWAHAPTASAIAELTVSPLIIELEGKPGTKLTETVTVSATGDEPVTVVFQHADFGFHEDTYQVDIIADTAPETTAFSTRGWFSVAAKRYTVQAGQSTPIPVTIAIPENATPGIHLGAAFFRTVVDSDTSGSQVLTSAQAGPLLFITVDGGSLPKPKIESFEVPGFVKNGPISADLRIENLGDTFFTYEGTVELTHGNQSWTEKVPHKYVIPGQPRDVRDASGEPLVLGKRKLKFGRYTVKTRLKIEPTGTRIVAERTVWVIPGWVRGLLVIGIGILVGALGWLAWWWRDRTLLNRAIAEGLLDDEDDGSIDVDASAEGDSAVDTVDEDGAPT